MENFTIAQLGQLIRDATSGAVVGNRRNLDFQLKANVDQNFEGIAQQVADMAVRKWGSQLVNDGAYTSDAQIATASVNALTAVVGGFYLKPPKRKLWADGTLMTITDRDVHPGDKEIEYGSAGGRYGDPDGNDGITGRDESPERSVGVAENTKKQRFVEVKAKIVITMNQMAEAAKRGFDVFARDTEIVKDKHLLDLNNIIRRGNKKHKVFGLCTHPGVRRRVATVDWGAANPDVIYDEYRACLRQIAASETEETLPELCVLPPLQYDHIMTEQFSLASDKTLKSFIEQNYTNHRMVEDPGMRAADSFDGPAAVFFTNDPRLVRCHAPYWMRMMPPHDLDPYKIEIHIVTRIAGVQVEDEDTILVVDGTPIGWQSTIE